MEKEATEGGGAEDETPVSSSPVARLIPPPSGLISDKITKAREETLETAQGDVLPQPVAEDAKKEEKPKRVRRRKKAEPRADQHSPDAPEAKEVKPEGPRADQHSPDTPEAKEVKPEEPRADQSETDTPKAQESPPQETGGDVNRVSIEEHETVSSTSFSTLDAPQGEPFGKTW